MKLKDLLTEGNDWRGKDIVVMQKAHERVLRAISTLDKAVINLQKVSNKNANKPNGKMFTAEANDMKKHLDKDVLNPNSNLWKAFLEYRKGGQAAFPNNWN